MAWIARALTFPVLLFGCDPVDDGETGEGSDESSTSSGTGDTQSDDSTSTGDTSTNSHGPYDTCGVADPTTGVVPPPADEYFETCESQPNRDSCVSIPTCEASGSYYWCTWERWVPVVWDGQGCIFGESESSCIGQIAHEAGCGGGVNCGEPDRPHQIVYGPQGTILIGSAQWCDSSFEEVVPCEFEMGQLVSGPPECNCICELPDDR